MGTEMTFRRGVAGFFARGHHPLPTGAEVLTRLFGGEPATYLDRVSTARTIVVQPTSDLLSYCGEALIDWIIAEAAQRRAQRAGRTGQPTSGGGWDPTPSSPCAWGTGLARCSGGSPSTTAPGTTRPCFTRRRVRKCS